MHTTLKLLSFSLSLAIVAALSGPQANAQQAGAETPMQSLAAQIRTQGFTCDKPLRATRDKQLSRPGRLSWVLQCSNASYRILLDPDMAAAVEPLR